MEKSQKYLMLIVPSTGVMLAVEKHLYSYVRQFEQILIEADAIERLVEDINQEQSNYFQTHHGRRVVVEVFRPEWTARKAIRIGMLQINLVPVKGIYKKED